MNALTPIFATLLISCPVQAAVTIYTDPLGFQSASTTLATDHYNDLAIMEYAGMSRSIGEYTYSASSGPTSDILYGGLDGEDGFLTNNGRTDTITLSGFSAGVTGIAGHFFSSNLSGASVAGSSIEVTVTDADGSTTYTLTETTRTSFLGFISDKPILSLAFRTPETSPVAAWPSIDNLVLVGTVPEPTQPILVGLGLVGLLARRRRSR